MTLWVSSDSEVDVISAPVPARESSGRVAAMQVTYAMDDSERTSPMK